MHLNHLNLVVQDVAGAVAFFETHFGFRCREVKGDNVIAVLHGSDGFVLVLMSAAVNKGDGAYPEAFHIGFIQDSKEAVEAAYAKLQEGNIEIGRAPARIRDSFGFYFYFETIMIEVGCYLL